MTPAETIQAAIDKLTQLRDKSTTGPWVVSRYQGDQEINAPMDDGNWTAVVDFYKRDSTDPELIVALHATIDAQLAALETGLRFVDVTPNMCTTVALDLARAILGEQVDA